MAHENSETIERDGRFYNVSGYTGEVLPIQNPMFEMDSYPTEASAVSAAIQRSDLYKQQGLLANDQSEIPDMPTGVLQLQPKKKPDTVGIGSLWDALSGAIAPIFNNTPIGYATNALRNTSKEEYQNIGREVAEGFYSDLPQGTIDLGVDIVNATGGLLNFEDDLIDRDKAQIVPSLYSVNERTKLGMVSKQDDSTARLMGQLLGGYAGLRSIATKGLIGEAIAVGGAGATLDPEQDNMSAMMQDTRFKNGVFEFLASGVDTEASAMERLQARAKTVAEELGLAFAPIGLMRGVTEMKNNPQVKAQIMDTFSPDRINKVLDNTIGLTGEPTFGIVQDNKTGILELVAQQSTESLPSKGIIEGRILSQMPIEIQQAHQIETNELIGSFVEDKIGLTISSEVLSPSSWQGNVGVSRQVKYVAETDANGNLTPEFVNKMEQANALYGKILDQDAVTAHYMIDAIDINTATIADLNVGRVITNDEMVKAQNVIDNIDEDFALVTSDNGLHIINYDGLDNELFQTITGKIGKEIGADGADYYDNGIGKAAIVGGNNYVEGQADYQRVSTSLGNTRTSNALESGQSYDDSVEQITEKVRENTKDFITRNPSERQTIRQIGEKSDLEAKANKQVIKIGDYSEEAKLAIGTNMYNEALAILKGGDKEARGWYTTKFQQAIESLSPRHPELASGQNQTARDLFTTMVAITSDGAKIAENMKFADDVYSSYKNTGRVDSFIPQGERAASYKSNLTILQDLIDEKGLPEALEWLQQTQQSNAIKAQYGINTGYLAPTMVPNSTVFGAKLGMFNANLMGQPDYLTMDRWWSRTFNRYRGQMLDQPTASSIKAFREVANLPDGMRDATVIKKAIEQAKIYAKGKFKDKTPLNQKANTIAKKMVGLRDAPQNASDRAFQMEITNTVAKQLKDEYPDMTVADLQAILWYGEKYRMKQLGSKAPVDVVDYSDVTEGLLKRTDLKEITGLLQ